MSIKHDGWIKAIAEAGMIEPAALQQVRYDEAGNKVVSYGISSYGYDARLAPEFILARMNNTLLDPKAYQSIAWEPTVYADSFVIPPHGFALTRTVEYFKIPLNVLCVVLGKSTYARLGLIVNATPLEPGWEGHITLELTNSTPLPVKVYANEGIAQILYFEGDEPAHVSYADKQGKYQGQKGIVMSRM